MKCRHCAAPLALSMLDLGSAPLSNAYLTEKTLRLPEKWLPLRVLVCTQCWLAQTADEIRAEDIFDAEYAYFSSTSTLWLDHARRYVDEMVSRLGLDAASKVVEVASNDGYLLQYVRDRGVPCLGVEPTASTAAAARGHGIEVCQAFFSAGLARELVAHGHAADLTVANNVLAHVPDINDFVAGFALLLKPGGVATFEFPHLLRLVLGQQFDTIYHEHYSYLSLHCVNTLFQRNGLAVFDVQEIPTHGGSLRVFAQRSDIGGRPAQAAVATVLAQEAAAGVTTPAFYRGVQAAAEQAKNELLAFLIDARRQGRKVAAYGAAAKGNTLLNFAGVRPDLLPWVVDRSPGKLGRYLPGSRIPIVDEARLIQERPDDVLILPWNLESEIREQLAFIREWGGRFVTAIPRLVVR